MTFHSVGNVIIPTDELTPSFFRGVDHQPGMFFGTKHHRKLCELPHDIDGHRVRRLDPREEDEIDEALAGLCLRSLAAG